MAQGSVKLGVSGIGEFKSAMQQARTATKTLDSELKLAQAQFRATGDAENYLQQRTSILNQQMAQQKTIVDQARAALKQMDRDGVDPASASYQQMKRSMTDAETEMIRLRQEAQKTGDEMTETATATTQASSAMSTLKQMAGFGSLVAGLATVKTIITQVAAKASELRQHLHESAQWADDLNTTAAQYGLSPEELQRWEYAAKFIDTDVDAILKARDKLMRKAGTDDYEFLSDGVKQWAVALRDVEGNARDSMDVFWDFIDVLKKVDNATERDRIAQEYFGKSFRDVQTLIQKGREEWDKYAAEAAVVSQESVDALNKVNDTRDRLENVKNAYERSWDSGRAEAEIRRLEEMIDIYQRMESGELSRAKGKLLLWDIEGAAGMDSLLESMGIDPNAFQAALGDELARKRLENQRAPESLKGAGGIPPTDGVYSYNPSTGEWRLVEQAANEAGKAAGESYVDGASEAQEAAYNAGLAAGQAAAAGFAAGAGAAGSVTNNNSTQNFGDTYNYYGTGGEDAAAAARRQAAGYGG